MSAFNIEKIKQRVSGSKSSESKMTTSKQAIPRSEWSNIRRHSTIKYVLKDDSRPKQGIVIKIEKDAFILKDRDSNVWEIKFENIDRIIKETKAPERRSRRYLSPRRGRSRHYSPRGRYRYRSRSRSREKERDKDRDKENDTKNVTEEQIAEIESKIETKLSESIREQLTIVASASSKQAEAISHMQEEISHISNDVIDIDRRFGALEEENKNILKILYRIVATQKKQESIAQRLPK